MISIPHSFIFQTRERVLPHPAHERLCARGGGRHSLRAETHPQVQQYLYLCSCAMHHVLPNIELGFLILLHNIIEV